MRSDLAMTGEVTLRGRALPIGGLKEKLLAAKMAGIREVLVPVENRKDIEEISEEIKQGACHHLCEGYEGGIGKGSRLQIGKAWTNGN